MKGNLLSGVAVSPIKFQGVSTLDELQAYGLLRPSTLENVKTSEIRHDKELLKAKDLRGMVQRRFTSDRRRNAESYAQYLRRVEVDSAQPGGSPAITIYTPHSELIDGQGLLLRYGVPIIAIDGETQTEARFILRELDAATGDIPIAITVYSNVSLEHAIQILVDYNSSGVTMRANVVGALDVSGHVTRCVKEAVQHAKLADNDIKRFGNIGDRRYVAAKQQLNAAVVGYAKGRNSLTGVYNAHYTELNDSGRPATFNGAATAAVKHLLEIAVQNDSLRRLPPSGWQAAGVLMNEGRDPTTLRYEDATRAIAEKRNTVRVTQRHALDVYVNSL